MESEKWIEIARTGTFTDSMGRPQTFTDTDLAAIAAAYNPQKRDAPLVFGHPKDNAPAFGWVRKVEKRGQKLFALFAHVPGVVKDLVAQQHYRHVSMSLMPDRVTLRHVALLGAAQPAIDGLQAVELADGDDAIDVTLADTHGGTMDEQELQRKIGQMQAQIEQLTTEKATLEKQLADATAGKDSAECGKADAEKKAEDLGAEFAAYKGKIENERREGRIAGLIKAGKVKPAEKESVLSFAAKLAVVDGTVDFATPDGTREAVTAEERYFRELEARPVDERFADFSAPVPGHVAPQAPTYNAAEMAAKL